MSLITDHVSIFKFLILHTKYHMYCYLESLEQLLKGACQEMKLAQFGDLLI